MDKFVHEYNANQIQVLEGLEAVRKRPGIIDIRIACLLEDYII